MKNLARAIRCGRALLGISQHDFGQVLGVVQTIVSRIETGDRRAKHHMERAFAIICAALADDPVGLAAVRLLAEEDENINCTTTHYINGAG